MNIQPPGFGLLSGFRIRAAARRLPAMLALALWACVPQARAAWSLVMTNGYGDCYRMNLLRDRQNYQAYRGICFYRGFSLSGCSTTGEVVMLRIRETPAMPEHFSLVSTSLRWGQTMYFLNDVFRPLNDWVMAGYENWYPFDMSCSVAMYVNSGGFGCAKAARPEPMAAGARTAVFSADGATGTNLIGALLPLTGDLADIGAAYRIALEQALGDIAAQPDLPPMRLLVADTRTDGGVAYDQMAALHARGCRIFLGPESSEECRMLKAYANASNVLLISSSSTAVPLAFPHDNLVRLTADDSHQARALAALLAEDGITDIAILSRSDIYGEGFLEALVREHAGRGGEVFAAHYCPRATGFFPEVAARLAAQVGERVSQVGARRVGVVIILFDEGVELLKQAAAWPALHGVRWYGTDGMSRKGLLAEDPLAAAAAAHVGLACTAPARYTNAP